MSSRRDSRVHISVRQNDALLEFENFKKKYLLVNKHITKINSTLSVRVEELNAQVSSLYVENLRLRASEIALTAQLKKEKENSQRIVGEAETAVGTLMQHLAEMRASLNINTTKAGPSSPLAQRKFPSLSVQPPRETIPLMRAPGDTITQIRESDEEDEDDTPTRGVSMRRPSTSRLPLPKLAAVPPTSIPHINLTTGTAAKRKVGRHSVLLKAEHVERPPSPVARPVRHGRSSLEREEEEREVEEQIQFKMGVNVIGEIGESEETSRMVDSKGKRRGSEDELRPEVGYGGAIKGLKDRELSRDWERDAEPCSTSERESSEGVKDKDKRRFGIKDVTNSPRKNVSEFKDETPVDEPVPTLTTPSSIPTPLFDSLTPRTSISPSLPSAASTPATDGDFEGREGTTGRERRTRRSVNYAEPKLNTKMRKPDPPPDASVPSKPRSSAGTATRRRKSIPTRNVVSPSDEDGDADVEGSGLGPKWMEGRRRTVHNAMIATNDLHLQASTANDDPYGMWMEESRRHSMAV